MSSHLARVSGEFESGHVVGEVEPSKCLAGPEDNQSARAWPTPRRRFRLVAPRSVLDREVLRERPAEVRVHRIAGSSGSLQDHGVLAGFEMEHHLGVC